MCVDKDELRRMAFMTNCDKYGIERMKQLWDFEVCSQKVAKKTLETSGCDFDKIWVLNARLAINPYTNRNEWTMDWRGVAYYLEEMGVISSDNVIDAIDKAKAYYNSITA